MNAQSLESIRLRRTLRRLIMLEISLIIIGVLIGFAEETLLPSPLQQYQEEVNTSGWSQHDWVFFTIGVPFLILLITSWIALWRGWSSGRRLYVAAWTAGLVANITGGPTITTPIAGTLDHAASLCAGVILGMLFFSDLRHKYRT